MTTPEEVNAKGKALALRMLDVMSPNEYDPPAVIHCLAFMFAALLKSTDGDISAYEQAGLGLLDDNARLDLFREEVLEIVRQMREVPSSQPKQRMM